MSAKTKDAESPAQVVQQVIDGIMEDHQRLHDMAAAAKDPDEKRFYQDCTKHTNAALSGLQNIMKGMK